MKNEKSKKNYYVGLDIGTNSVGYAVTDEQYQLIKFKGDPMWGTHIFEEASLANDRRLHRTARRRLDRRQQRVALVGELFAQEICKIDEDLFKRIQHSALFPQDEESKFRLFKEMDEYKRYNKKYPTIHHLIVDLMDGKANEDVRHLYFACAWLVAHRGHFLNDVSKEQISEVINVDKTYGEFVSFIKDAGDVLDWSGYQPVFEEVLPQKMTITKKSKELATRIFSDGKAPKEISEEHPYNVEQIIKLLSGAKVSLKDLFGKEEYAELENKSIALSADDETMSKTIADLNDDGELILKLKALFDWSLLVNVLKGSNTISEAKVKIYEEHKKDLKILKRLTKKYLTKDNYNAIFRSETDTFYQGYVNSKVSQEEFCKLIKNAFKDVIIKIEDKESFDEMMQRIEIGIFMPKQVDSDNRVIPYQLYWYEMKLLLEKAESTHPFLSYKDDNGWSVKDKLLSIMEYKIPYYVGPLNKSSQFAWIERKAQKIYPWNFEEVVDLDKSEQAFIKKMTNNCTYLPGEPVLAKNSLCYVSFEVLNEINNIKINGNSISVECKQGIYNDLFKKYPKVTCKKIKDYLISNNYMQKEDVFSGVDEKIKSSLKPYLAFRKILESGTLTEAAVENIILQKAYSEDKNRFKKWLNKQYPQLVEEDVKYIASLSLKEFGRFSKALLCEILGADKESGTGEAFSIIETMWNTNCNLMQILSDRFTFRESIDEIAQDYYKQNSFSLNEKLDEMWISNQVKRPIMRTLDILKDINNVMRHAPKRIFVEMTRGGDEKQKGVRTKSRYQQIKELYDLIKTDDVRELNKQLDAMGDSADNMLQSDVLFLYYMQLGRCMYTGEPIDITKLKDGTYNVEHIYPRSLVKDDSIINNKCLVLSKVNAEKSDTYPIDSAIQSKMNGFWKHLKDISKDGRLTLLSEEKYKRLTRTTPFTETEKLGFINRQLVETSQATKAISTLLKDMYNDKAEIVYVKAGLVSDFRNEVIKMHKSRLLNDLHHAKDAYLNVAVGNVYHCRFSKKYYKAGEGYNLKAKVIFGGKTICGNDVVWDHNALETVKKFMLKNNVHYTTYQFVRKGGYFDQNPVKKAEGLVPLKKDKPTAIYGGYNKPTASFFVFAKYNVGKKKEITLVPVSLLASKAFMASQEYRMEYVKNYLIEMSAKNAKAENLELLFNARPIKINTTICFDGLKLLVSGKMNNNILLKIGTPLILGAHLTEYLKKLETYEEKMKKNPHIKLDSKYDGITQEDNIKLYDTYLEKLNNTAFSKRPNTPINLIKEGRSKFVKFNIIDQVKLLLQIQQLFMKGAMSNLELIGGSSLSGKTTVSSNLSNWKKNYSDVRIINTSASGFYESSSENLLDLI
ncbi:MAG: type II CRISPR RNA-guided endonuclease Cas9 [Clostridia bacterium]|nr:type II CRISPR RNA-guided endonuclease Cas9 [Clostridia bacterium]